MQAGTLHDLHDVPLVEHIWRNMVLSPACRSLSVSSRGIRHQRLLVKSASAVDQVSLSWRSKLRVQAENQHQSIEQSQQSVIRLLLDNKMVACQKCLTGLQKTSDTKFADYQPHVAFFFPGQGAQAVGMAKVCSHCQILGMICLCTGIYIAHKHIHCIAGCCERGACSKTVVSTSLRHPGIRPAQCLHRR